MKTLKWKLRKKLTRKIDLKKKRKYSKIYREIQRRKYSLTKLYFHKKLLIDQIYNNLNIII